MMKQRSTIRMAVLLAALMAAGTTTARADSYGAISISPESGATGWSHNYSSRWQAEERSQSNCYDYSGDCRVAIWFKNACGAVARGYGGGWGANWGADRWEAEDAALASCQRHADGCKIIRWQCSGAN